MSTVTDSMIDLDGYVQEAYEHSVILSEKINDITTLENLTDADTFLELDQTTLEAAFVDGKVISTLSTEAVDIRALKQRDENRFKNLMRSLAAQVVQGWDLSLEFYNSTFKSVDAISKEVREMGKVIDGLDTEQIRDMELILRREAVTLSKDWKMVRDDDDIMTNLHVLRKHLDYVLLNWLPEVLDTGKKLLSAVNANISKSPVELLEAMLDAAEELDFDKMQKDLKMDLIDLKKGSVNTYISEGITGNKSLVSYRPDERVIDSVSLSRSVGLRGRDLRMQGTPNRKSMDDYVEMETFSKGALHDMYRELTAIVDILEKWERNATVKQLEAIGRQLQTRMERGNMFIFKGQYDDYKTSSYKFVGSLLRWTTKPTVDVLGNATSVVRAALMVYNRSLNKYKK